MVVFLFLLSAMIIALGKGIADIVSDEPNWKKSIFSKYPINSFFGCKDNTWERKYRDNKVLNYLFTTILVWTTDIWHFGNTISKFGYYFGLIMVFLLPYSFIINLCLILVHVIINTLSFHLFYHRILRI